MNHSRNLLYLLVIFFTGIVNINSQTICLQGLEDKINSECENCNQADLNIYLYKECTKVDSVIQKLTSSFEKSINNKYAKNKDLRFKRKMESLYFHTIKDIRKIKTNTIRGYSDLNTESAENDYFRYLFYIYWSYRIVDMITYYIDTVEEN